jgi:hypothetical protein
MNDWKSLVRPILAIISLCALIYFYTLQVVGYAIPAEINGFWVPVSYWFVERTVGHIKEG